MDSPATTPRPASSAKEDKPFWTPLCWQLIVAFIAGPILLGIAAASWWGDIWKWVVAGVCGLLMGLALIWGLKAQRKSEMPQEQRS